MKKNNKNIVKNDLILKPEQSLLLDRDLLIDGKLECCQCNRYGLSTKDEAWNTELQVWDNTGIKRMTAFFCSCCDGLLTADLEYASNTVNVAVYDSKFAAYLANYMRTHGVNLTWKINKATSGRQILIFSIGFGDSYSVFGAGFYVASYKKEMFTDDAELCASYEQWFEEKFFSKFK